MSACLTAALFVACAPDEPGTSEVAQEIDPNPIITFTQVAGTAGINRSNEPPSAGVFASSGTLAYGSWLADLDGDGRVDYYGVNHSQTPHRSGLFVNNGSGFGRNLFTVALQPSMESFPNMGNSNEVSFVGDLTGDGRVDFFFKGWVGLGVMCASRGIVSGSDWTGPGYTCYGTTDALAFADVNGDGRMDMLAVSPSGFDTYAAYYAHTGTYMWRLNNGTPNVQSWPTTTDFLSLRVTDPSSPYPPFVDLDRDGIPDKIVGIPTTNRGTYGTATAGKQVFLGQASGYVLRNSTGLEAVTAPITTIEDVNDDGCLDIGTDQTGYRDNQSWYVQNKTGSACNVTFTFTPRTALPYYPGFKRYSVDIDNSGLLSKVVLIHRAYGNNDGRPAGASIYRKRPDGTYAVILATQSGINITGTSDLEAYPDNLSPGDWNDDGRIDLAGTGGPSIPNTDAGFGLWTSGLATTNGWIKISLPTVTGFFTGAATIELFDPGFVGDPAHVVTPPRTLYSGRTWASQIFHFGIGTRTAVDVRVTFPDGRQTVRRNVTPSSRLAITPATTPPNAVATAQPTSANVGQTVSFDGRASNDPDGSITQYVWDFGDGVGATGATTSHAYQQAGTFVARLTVTDNGGATSTTTLTIAVAGTTTPPTISIGGSVFTPSVSANVVRVEWYLDGALSATTTTPPFSYTLDLAPLAGSHTLFARAYDANANATNASSVIIQK